MMKYAFYVIISLMLVGCGREVIPQEESKDALFLSGQRCLSENRSEEAFKLFSRLCTQRPEHCPETHFELGQLYLSVKKDPIFAIYHFRQYLIQEPEGKRVHLVLQMIETAKKEFSRTLPLNDRYSESPEYLNLIEVLKQVRSENVHLKTQLAQVRLAKEEAKQNLSEVVAPVHSDENYSERTYTVQNEDSLSKISLKMYGSAVKWNIIYEANRDILPSANSLKIGMKLRIPPLRSQKARASHE